MRVATENLLGEFLREIQEITMVQRAFAERARREAEGEHPSRKTDVEKDKLPDITMASSERATFLPEHDDDFSDDESTTPVEEKETEEVRERGSKHPVKLLFLPY